MRTACLDILIYQRRALQSGARFTWNCWARQVGKSFTFALRSLMRGLNRRRDQIILSAGLRQSREVMLKIRQHCESLKVHADLTETSFYKDTRIRQLEIELPGGARIIGLPANPLTARGYSGDVFLDEFAMHADDKAIWASLFPTLMRCNGELDIASTPRGRRNMFHQMRRNKAFVHSTLTLDAAIAQGLTVDRARLRAGIDDELAWRQEFCCEFLDESTCFMPHELICRCHDPLLGTAVDEAALERRRADILIGVDVGRVRDVSAIWIWEKTGTTYHTRGVIALDDVPFVEQEAVVAGLLRHRSVRRCCIDATGLGRQFAEGLARRFGEHRVEAVHFSAALKGELAGRLRVCAERGLLRIPVDEAIIRDWHSMSREVTSGGGVRFDSDRSGGGHGDRFWAAALGLHADQGDGGPVEFTVVDSSIFVRSGAW